MMRKSAARWSAPGIGSLCLAPFWSTIFRSAPLVVNRSARHMFAQIVDDSVGRTLAAASTLDAEIRAGEGDKTAKARRVGGLLAQRAAQAGIEAVVFDRGGYRYHGRIAALADGAREGGLRL